MRSSFLTRDISISGGIDLSDTEAVANAVNTQTECVGCHQALDPLAANLWGVREVLNFNTVRRAYEEECDGNEVYNCYPLATYNPAIENGWETRGLRPPGYYGDVTTGLRTLAQSITTDPRFHQCTTRRFYSYLTQVQRDEVPLELVATLTDTFENSGWNAKALTKAIVLSNEFAAAHDEVATGETHLASLQSIRPIQLNRSVAALTGFEWVAKVDRPTCRDNYECWGDQNLFRGDGYGFRLMAGGVEGYSVTRPIHTTTPVRSLIVEAFAVEAAAYAVDQALINNDRRLFTIVSDENADEAQVRSQLAEFHKRFWGEMVEADSPEVDETFALFTKLYQDSADPRATWILTLSAFMQDTKFLYY